jgi:hypothetical protein
MHIQWNHGLARKSGSVEGYSVETILKIYYRVVLKDEGHYNVLREKAVQCVSIHSY